MNTEQSNHVTCLSACGTKGCSQFESSCCSRFCNCHIHRHLKREQQTRQYPKMRSVLLLYERYVNACRPILTYHKKELNLTRLHNGNVQFSIGQSSATIVGEAFESCKQGSLLYSVVGTLSSDDLIPRLNGWDYRGALPTQHHSRPFLQVAGMIMMFAIVLVLTLAFVACCRGRRQLRGRSFFNGTFMPFGQKRVPEGPPPPPPPKVRFWPLLYASNLTFQFNTCTSFTLL